MISNVSHQIDKLVYIKVLFALSLLVICSKINLYLFQIPFTLQTFAVMLIGYFFNRVVILSTFASYFCLAFLKAPVLAGASPALLIASPTFGYLIGFVIAALFINQHKYRSAFATQQLSLFLLAHLIILVSGASFIAILTGNAVYAFKIGFLPFILTDLAKVFLVLSVIKFVRHKER